MHNPLKAYMATKEHKPKITWKISKTAPAYNNTSHENKHKCDK